MVWVWLSMFKVKWNQIESLEKFHNLKAAHEIQTVYYVFEPAQIVVFKLIPPINKNFFGMNLYQNLLNELSSWAVKLDDSKSVNLVLGEYEVECLKDFTPSSLFPISFINKIEFFTPINLLDSIKEYFKKMSFEFGDECTIVEQWSLSSPVLGKNYEDYQLFNPSDKDLNRLSLLYVELYSNKNHVLYINKNIRFQTQISLCLLSINMSTYESFISEADIVLMGIVNLLRWPNLYKCTELVYSEISEPEQLNHIYKLNDFEIDFKKELVSYTSYIESTYPSVISDFKIKK